MTAFKDLCLDAADPTVVGRFWAAALGQQLEVLDGGDCDRARSRLPAASGSTRARAEGREEPGAPRPLRARRRRRWSTSAPPCSPNTRTGRCSATRRATSSARSPARRRAGAACRPRRSPSASTAPTRPDRRVVAGPPRRRPSAPAPTAAPAGSTAPAGLEDIILKFVPVDDERVAKNRSHWDVATDDLAGLVAAGATVVREQDDEIELDRPSRPRGQRVLRVHRLTASLARPRGRSCEWPRCDVELAASELKVKGTSTGCLVAAQAGGLGASGRCRPRRTRLPPTNPATTTAPASTTRPAGAPEEAPPSPPVEATGSTACSSSSPSPPVDVVVEAGADVDEVEAVEVDVLAGAEVDAAVVGGAVAGGAVGTTAGDATVNEPAAVRSPPVLFCAITW